MQLKIVFLGLATLAFTLELHASVNLEAPQVKPGTYADVHSLQGVGRVEASSDGRFFVYEWGRPYLNWVPQTRWMAPKAARRLQTFLYKVDLTRPGSTSEYLFYPNAGCTYWLGDISPDNRRVIIFELDHDDQRVRAGIYDLEDGDHMVQWLGPRPDEARLEEFSAWISNTEFIYPAKDSKGSMIQASALTKEAWPCAICSVENLRQIREDAASFASNAKNAAARIDRSGVPEDAELVTGAANGSLAIFVQDNKDVLSILFKQSKVSGAVLFENPRKWEAPKLPQPPLSDTKRPHADVAQGTISPK